MLRAPKKLTKKQIKEDKFVTLYLQAQDYLQANSRQLLAGAAILVVVVAATFIFAKTRAQKEEAAVVELTKGRIEYFAENYDTAIGILQNLVEEYEGTNSAAVGKFYLANAYFNSGNFINAEFYFREYLDSADDELLAPSAMSGLAACLEQQGNVEEAAQTYLKAAREYSDSYLAAENLYHAARCFRLSGKLEEAKLALSELIDDHPKSTYKNTAEIMLGEIEGLQTK